MKKIYVQRKVEVWVQEIYEVEEINDTTINDAIEYNLDVDEEETLWETQVELGPVEVYNEHRKKIYSNIDYDE